MFLLGTLLAPVWWVAGWIQFIWLPLIILILVLHLARGGKVRFPIEASLLVAFLMAQLLSVGGIQDNYRYATFAKAFWGYLTLLLLFVYAAGYPNPTRLLTIALKSLIALAVASVLVSAAAQVAWWFDGTILGFETLSGNAVPSWIRSTSLGQAVFSPSAGRLDWFMGVPYLRHTAMNLFATTYSMALVAMLPLLLWAFRTRALELGRGWRLAAGLGFSGGVVALLLTTGRMSMLGLLLGAAWYGLVRWPRLRWAVSTMLLGFTGILVVFGPEYVGELVYARGEGSVVTRYQIYAQTWLHFLSRPVFGWGAELDVVGLGYPLGSHSHYLSVLFRFGLVGLAVWGMWMAALWRRVQIVASREARSYLGWALVAVFVNGLTDVWDLDLLTLHVLGLVFVTVYLASGSRMERSSARLQEGYEAVGK